MPVMNSYSVVVVDQCVDANLLRRSAYKVFYAGISFRSVKHSGGTGETKNRA